LVGSPIKWFGLAPYNPQIEVQPLFVTTRRPPRLRREPLRDTRRIVGDKNGGVGSGGSIDGITDKASDGVADNLALLAKSVGKAGIATAGAEQRLEKTSVMGAAGDNETGSNTGKTGNENNGDSDDNPSDKSAAHAADATGRKSAAGKPSSGESIDGNDRKAPASDAASDAASADGASDEPSPGKPLSVDQATGKAGAAQAGMRPRSHSHIPASGEADIPA
jgi:KUP system potassium uptake protein